MSIDITVTGNFNNINSLAIGEIKKQLIPKLQSLLLPSLLEAQKQVRIGLENTGEYRSLLGGQLQKDFGIAEPKPILDNIVKAIQDSIKVELIKGNAEILGGIYIGIYRDDFSDALSVNGIKYESTNKDGRVSLVDWLNWLLFKGDTIIISDYGIFQHARDPNAKSRTNSGHIMVRSVGKKITPFRVQPIFSGIQQNNWLTRAAEITAIGMKAYLENQLKALLSG